jgi:hypothetical protein
MNITIHIYDAGQRAQLVFKGNYALELMFFQLSEKYYGKDIRLKIESVIKSRIKEE